MFLHVFESETKKGPSTTSQNVLENRSKLNLGKNSSPVPPRVPALNVCTCFHELALRERPGWSSESGHHYSGPFILREYEAPVH